MMGLDTVKICAMALLTAVCFAVVRKVNPSFDMPLRISAVAVFFGLVLSLAAPLFLYLSELVDASPLSSWQGVLFGALGIALLCHTAAELCRECGETSVAGFVELAGKVEILLLCLPLVKEIIGEVERLVG